MANIGSQFPPTKSLPTMIAIILCLLFSIILPSAAAAAVSVTDDCGITIFWGQNIADGELDEACDAMYDNRKLYNRVNIAFLYKFGNYQTPELNLAGHCSGSSCTKYGAQIKHCQDIGIKVLLSIGGGTPNTYDLESEADADFLADYIWNHFLAGNAPPSERPLGDAILDGVDFDIEKPTDLHYNLVAEKLASYSTATQKVYLSASPPCKDGSMKYTISTGRMDYIGVQFYNDASCDYYGGGSSNVIAAWNRWSSTIPNGSELILGLPASPEAAPAGGYIPPLNLKTEILPVIRPSSKYAGVSLWSRNQDKASGYSRDIYPEVCAAAPGGSSATLINNILDVSPVA